MAGPAHLDATFAALADPRARLLNGHSSGGWSSLWLQVTYPEFFGGTWSTSPDPVDFRDFQRINVYSPGENMFRDAEGKPRAPQFEGFGAGRPGGGDENVDGGPKPGAAMAIVGRSRLYQDRRRFGASAGSRGTTRSK